MYFNTSYGSGRVDIIYDTQHETSCIIIYTIKPVLRCHLWEKEKCTFKTGDLLQEVQLICNFL